MEKQTYLMILQVSSLGHIVVKIQAQCVANSYKEARDSFKKGRYWTSNAIIVPQEDYRRECNEFLHQLGRYEFEATN